VTATLSDVDDNPVAGETINFNLTDNESGGSIDPLSAVTNVNGQATITYTAGFLDQDLGPREDTILARSDSNSAIEDDTIITVDKDAIVVGAVEVTTGSSILVADGSDTMTIRAEVSDIDGNPAPDIDVEFQTTAGTLSNADLETNQNGIAEATLTSGTKAGNVTVFVEANGFIGTAEVEFKADVPARMEILAPDELDSGEEFDSIYVVVWDENDNPVEGVTVTLDRELGFLSLLKDDTNESGRISAVYTAPEVDVNATETISAFTTNFEEQTATIEIIAP